MFRALAFVTVTVTAAHAQIVTDRPDLTESAVSVDVGQIQIESGVLATDEGEATSVAGPSALVRIGVVPGVEARLALPDYLAIDPDGAGPTVDGFTDPSIGAKVELATVSGWDLAAIAEVSLPLGDDVFSGAASPLALFIAGRDLGGLSLGTQGEVLWDREADRVDVGGTAVLGVSLTDAVGAFFEVAGGSSAAGASVLTQIGSTLLLSPDVQLDAHVATGLTAAAPDLLGGVGLSARF